MRPVQSVKLAIVTHNQRFHDAERACFAEGGHDIVLFSEDKSLIRAIGRDSFSAIIIDTSDGLGARDSRPVLASRDCQSKYQAPLILVGHFADRESLDQAFSVGADDVVRLPIDVDELYVRTLRAIRRGTSSATTTESM